MVFLQLFYEFFKTGLFSIGGGLATLPFLQQIARNYPWYTVAELADMIAISESTPGPIGVNMATYAGYQAASVPGAITATLSLVLPSILVILLIAKALERFRDSKLVKDAFSGLRPATAGLIAGAAYSIYELSLLNLDAFAREGIGALFRWGPIALFVILTVLIKKLPRLHPILFIVAGAVVGIVFQL